MVFNIGRALSSISVPTERVPPLKKSSIYSFQILHFIYIYTYIYMHIYIANIIIYSCCCYLAIELYVLWNLQLNELN